MCASVTYIDPNGRRVTSESSYLTPEVQKRSNLRIISSTTVTKVIFDEAGDQPRAIGIEYATSRDGPRSKAGARKEVILWSVLQPQFLADEVDFVPKCRGNSFTPCERAAAYLSLA